MHSQSTSTGRRDFLKWSSFSLAAFTTPGLMAEELIRTPSMTEGPFYPDRMPLDTDNDLLVINDSITPAVGEITHLTGKVLDSKGNPLRNAFVEIWQVDSKASYIHTRGANKDGRDSNFQGYGRFLTDSRGQYYFRTIKPVPYRAGRGFRTPHIHVAVSQNGKRILTTQLLVKGHAMNAEDGVYRQIRDPEQKKTILVDFKPLPDSKLGELAANFDIILGKTAEENPDGTIKGGIGKSEIGNRQRPPRNGAGGRPPRS
ncbi:Protocatechuate 3,4-dioxygenase beta chain [Gimesia panareensis]|uniref:Protocatechuate 3,4-dioxygenase beta chain n=1 Tax=Gimesia panareensis TaxID=2527978 RepID=A0A517QB86_9PLAN|nr:protocatechuate 3,4-dioxygenase [Gimesia panareensis]QDT28835.1 Protocatechuate 3,4-dioxygenase beta chain [Gimesia panareensis]